MYKIITNLSFWYVAWMMMRYSTWLGHPGTDWSARSLGFAREAWWTNGGGSWHDEYEEDEQNLQIFVHVILVLLLYCIISYIYIHCPVFMFILFSPLWGLFSKPSRYCELHWLRCRAHQWMPRFRWRLDYLPSNWGRELPWWQFVMQDKRQLGQLSNT